MSRPQLNTLICSGKAPTELWKIPVFNAASIPKQELNVGIYLQMEYRLSEILNYISRNFYRLYSDPDIALLQQHELKLLLKHKYLKVDREDEVLKAVCMWASARQESLHRLHGNVDHMASADPELQHNSTTIYKPGTMTVSGLSEVL